MDAARFVYLHLKTLTEGLLSACFARAEVSPHIVLYWLVIRRGAAVSKFRIGNLYCLAGESVIIGKQ